jgi:hypothetical protein
MRPQLAVMLVTMVSWACASTPTPKALPLNPVETSDFESDFEDPFQGPKRWDNLIEHYEFDCPVNDLKLEENVKVTLAATKFIIEGSTIKLDNDSWGNKLKIGILAGIEDPSARTLANLRYAAKVFKKEKVDFLLINGDMGGSRDDIFEIMKALVRLFPFPILFHSGNTEPTSVLNRTFSQMQKEYPRLINMNWVRHLDLGTIHLLSLPGHHERSTLYAGGCQYKKDDVDYINLIAQKVAAEGHTAILSAHNVPKSKGRKAIDYAFTLGNAGDPQITQLIAESTIPFGIFSHIAESGGRATRDLFTGKPFHPKKKKTSNQLYMNVGSTTSTPILMHSRSSSRGMAAIFSLNNRQGNVKFIKLQPLWKHGYRKTYKKKKKKKRKAPSGAWKGL